MRVHTKPEYLLTLVMLRRRCKLQLRHSSNFWCHYNFLFCLQWYNNTTIHRYNDTTIQQYNNTALYKNFCFDFQLSTIQRYSSLQLLPLLLLSTFQPLTLQNFCFCSTFALDFCFSSLPIWHCNLSPLTSCHFLHSLSRLASLALYFSQPSSIVF